MPNGVLRRFCNFSQAAEASAAYLSVKQFKFFEKTSITHLVETSSQWKTGLSL